MCSPEVAEQLQAVLPQLASDETQGEVRLGKPIRLSGDDLVAESQAEARARLDRLVRPIGTFRLPPGTSIGEAFKQTGKPLTDMTKPSKVVPRRLPKRKDI